MVCTLIRFWYSSLSQRRECHKKATSKRHSINLLSPRLVDHLIAQGGKFDFIDVQGL